jgi:hypothetical protein
VRCQVAREAKCYKKIRHICLPLGHDVVPSAVVTFAVQSASRIVKWLVVWFLE